MVKIMPDVLTNKQYKEYNKVSRYSNFPIYYNILDNKYIQGTTAYLNNTTAHSLYTVVKNDTYDSIALKFYGTPIFYWIICSFNHIQDPFIPPKVGDTLMIPVFSTITYDES